MGWECQMDCYIKHKALPAWQKGRCAIAMIKSPGCQCAERRLTTNAHLEKPHQVPLTLTRYSLLLPACHHEVTDAGGTCLPCCTSDCRQGTSGVAKEVL